VENDTSEHRALVREAVALVEDAGRLHSSQRAAGDAPLVMPHPLFSSLEVPALRAMLEAFEPVLAPGGQVVVREGDEGTQAFVVVRGELVVSRVVDGEEQQLARLTSGALFGEMALMSRAPRAATVTARRPTVLLAASNAALDAVAASHPEVGLVLASHCRKRMVDNLVRTSPILRALEPAERRDVVSSFRPNTYEPGDYLIRQGEEGSGIHLVASGEVEVVHQEADGPLVLARLGVGQVAGEVSLVLRRPANADVIAKVPTISLHLSRQRFLDAIKEHPALLSELYELAVRRDEETSSIVAQEAASVDDVILL
jgi:cAMP-dependent protein kinase regulator